MPARRLRRPPASLAFAHARPAVPAGVPGAALLAPALLRTLAEGGHTRANYRERLLAFPFGVLIVAAALIALIPLVLLQRLAGAEVFHPEVLPIALYALGVATLGLIDDTLGEARAGSGPPARSTAGPARRRALHDPLGRPRAAGAVMLAPRCTASCRRGRSRPPARSAWRCSR